MAVFWLACPASTLDLLLCSHFPTSGFRILIRWQSLPSHQLCFPLSMSMHSSICCVCSEAFFSQFLLMHVSLCLLHLNWIVLFLHYCGSTAAGFVRMNYPKIRLKTADVRFGLEPEQACSSNNPNGKHEVAFLVQIEFLRHLTAK